MSTRSRGVGAAISALFVGWILGGCAAPTTPIPENGAAWEPIAGAPALQTARFDDVAFVNGSTGWLSGANATTFRTTDGGATWAEISPVKFRAVGFATASVGWGGRLNTENLVGNALYETTDGGVSWLNVSSRISGADVVGICGIWVMDPQIVFAVGRWFGPARFLKSSDGGTSWQSTDMSALASGLVDVRFFDADRGIVAGQRAGRAVILRTVDGGQTWTTAYLGTVQDTRVWKLSFPSEAVGYASVLGAGAPGIVLKSVDGGVSWNELAVQTGTEFFGVGFVTTERGWAASPASLFETDDGGATWNAIPVGIRVNRIRFLGNDVGFAAGATVYRFRKQ